MKKIKKVIIYSHEKYFTNSSIKKIISHLKKNNIKLTLISQHSEYARIESTNEIINNCNSFTKSNIDSDLIIVFGGDGLFLTASKIAINLGIARNGDLPGEKQRARIWQYFGQVIYNIQVS